MVYATFKTKENNDKAKMILKIIRPIAIFSGTWFYHIFYLFGLSVFSSGWLLLTCEPNSILAASASIT